MQTLKTLKIMPRNPQRNCTFMNSASVHEGGGDINFFLRVRHHAERLPIPRMWRGGGGGRKYLICEHRIMTVKWRQGSHTGKNVFASSPSFSLRKYIVLFCTVLYFNVLYFTVLYCTVLYCTVQQPSTSNVRELLSVSCEWVLNLALAPRRVCKWATCWS